MAARTAWELVEDVPDPEMPWVTLGDLGIVRDVTTGADQTVRVAITPTYLGCPAIEAMRADVAEVQDSLGLAGRHATDVFAAIRRGKDNF